MDEQKKALDYAARALGYRMLSEKELSTKLLQKGFSHEDCQFAIEKMREFGGINDDEYAENIIASLKNKGYGIKRIKEKLREKGIKKDIFEEKIEDFEPDYEKMKRYIDSKIGGNEPTKDDMRKIYRALFRKVFSNDEIKRALKEYINNEDYYEL